MSVDLKAGNWYRTRDKSIVYCLGVGPCKDNAYPVLCSLNEDCDCIEWYKPDGKFTNKLPPSTNDIIEHLPDCTGFNWVEPSKSPKFRPFTCAEEFKPFRDKWFRRKGGCLCKVAAYDDVSVTFGTCDRAWLYTECLTEWEFEDGSPFGILSDANG